MDKNFFAQVCHNCNNHVGFVEQCIASLTVTIVPPIVVIAGWTAIYYIGKAVINLLFDGYAG